MVTHKTESVEIYLKNLFSKNRTIDLCKDRLNGTIFTWALRFMEFLKSVGLKID